MHVRACACVRARAQVAEALSRQQNQILVCVSALTPAAVYLFRVRAVNSAGEGAYSASSVPVIVCAHAHVLVSAHMPARMHTCVSMRHITVGQVGTTVPKATGEPVALLKEWKMNKGVVTIDWQPPPHDGGSAILHYDVQQGSGDDDTGWAAVQAHVHARVHAFLPAHMRACKCLRMHLHVN